LQKKGSAQKRHRQNLKRRMRNRPIRTRVRTAEGGLDQAVEAKDKGAAEQALKRSASLLDSAAAKGVIHPNAAARKKSRLATRIAGLTGT
jgi:small subunit ribosomal protein S20